MFDQQLFFQIAAALIPAILFGGLVSGAFRPPEGDGADWVKTRDVVAVAVAIGVAVVAEFFTIEIATSAARPPFAKVYIVVLVVAGAAVLAGWALLRPWIQTLPERYRFYARPMMVILGGVLFFAGVWVLSTSIIDAEAKAEDQRANCVSVQAERVLRETRLDMTAASQEVDASWASLLQLRGESIRLRYETGLTRAERAALQASLKDRTKAARDRWKQANDAFVVVLKENPLIQVHVPRGAPKGAFLEAFTRALGC